MTICVSVNNAGFVLGVEKIGDISEDDMEAMFRTNVFGLIAVTQLFIKGTMPLPLLSILPEIHINDNH